MYFVCVSRWDQSKAPALMSPWKARLDTAQRQPGTAALGFLPQRRGPGGACACVGGEQPSQNCQLLSLHHPSGSGWHDRSSFLDTWPYLDIPDAALCPLLSLPFSRESLFSAWSHLLIILLAVKLHLLTFLRSFEPALSDICVFCICLLLHSLWVVTSPGVMYPGSINAIKIFMHIVAKRLGVFE